MKNKFHPLLAVIFFVVTIPIRAQVATNTGSIYGKVFDEKDAPISGVNILLESDAVPGKCASPSPGGAFRFANLPPGITQRRSHCRLYKFLEGVIHGLW